MKKRIALTAMILVALLLMALSAQSQPQLTLEETVFDFGYVPQNSKISHVFWLHSTGEDTLKILKVVPG